MHTIYFFTIFAITTLLTCPPLIKLKFIKNKLSYQEYNDYVEKIVSAWARCLLKASGTNFNVTGLDNIPKETVLFVSNHQSNFDIPFFLSHIRKPKGFVSKIDMLKIPVINRWMKNMHCVFMDRDDLKQSLQCIIDGINILKQGQSMVVFPEGTRSKSNKIGEFKAGAFKLATKSLVPIVPVTINGTYKIMEGNNNKIKKAVVNVTIHKPIITKNLSKQELSNLHKIVYDIINNPIF